MYNHILVPVVLSDGEGVAASYAAARALANRDAKFSVIHVLEEIPGFVAVDIPSNILTKAAESADKALKESAKALPGATAKLLRGNAGTAILNYAEENGVDCIIIASHKPGIEDYFLGSTAARVVRHAQCSVHVIR